MTRLAQDIFKDAAVRREIAEVLNRNGVDNDMETPDYILAEYLVDCLSAYGRLRTAYESHIGAELSRAATSVAEKRGVLRKE